MLIQNYYAPQKLPSSQGEGSVYWSVNPTGHAILFIHGFLGQTIGTW